MLRLTDHVRQRMAERRIPVSWVEAAVQSPDWTGRDRNPELAHAFKEIADFGGRILKVVHRRDGADILVVTAYFDRGARRP